MNFSDDRGGQSYGDRHPALNDLQRPCAGAEKGTPVKTVIPLIRERQERYREHAFLQFLQDETISPEERLSYAPYACFFSMTFSEFNRHYIRIAAPASEHEKALNAHAEEDETHYQWFLQDLERLGYNPVCTLTEALGFVWSKEGQHARDLSHYLVGLAQNADPELKVVILEAIEATGVVWLQATVAASRQHPEAHNLHYFNETHEGRELDFVASEGHDAIGRVVLSDATRQKAPAIVHGIFDRMEAFNDELLRRVKGTASDRQFFQRTGDAETSNVAPV